MTHEELRALLVEAFDAGNADQYDNGGSLNAASEWAEHRLKSVASLPSPGREEIEAAIKWLELHLPSGAQSPPLLNIIPIIEGLEREIAGLKAPVNDGETEDAISAIENVVDILRERHMPETAAGVYIAATVISRLSRQLTAALAERDEARKESEEYHGECQHWLALACDDPGANPPRFWKARAEEAEAALTSAFERGRVMGREDAAALEAALERIVSLHLGDCPASMDEVDFARAHNSNIRRIARDALRTLTPKGDA